MPSEAAQALAAQVFSALGDPARLALLSRLDRGPLSIHELAQGGAITRQGVTKHLHVLEAAGLVASTREGRATRFRARPEGIAAARAHLDAVAAAWDARLARLRAQVEG